DFPSKSDNRRYSPREFSYGAVFTDTNVNELQRGIILQNEHASICKIIDVKKFSPRHSRAPDDNGGRIVDFCFVEPSDQRRNDMAILRMIIVSRTIKVGRHHRYEITTILPTVGLAKFDACNLSDGIRFVCRLERASQQLVFAHRLFGEFRINAT